MIIGVTFTVRKPSFIENLRVSFEHKSKAVCGSHPKVFAAICWPICRTTVTSTGWSQERGELAFQAKLMQILKAEKA